MKPGLWSERFQSCCSSFQAPPSCSVPAKVQSTEYLGEKSGRATRTMGLLHSNPVLEPGEGRQAPLVFKASPLKIAPELWQLDSRSPPRKIHPAIERLCCVVLEKSMWCYGRLGISSFSQKPYHFISLHLRGEGVLCIWDSWNIYLHNFFPLQGWNSIQAEAREVYLIAKHGLRLPYINLPEINHLG